MKLIDLQPADNSVIYLAWRQLFTGDPLSTVWSSDRTRLEVWFASQTAGPQFRFQALQRRVVRRLLAELLMSLR